MRELILDANTLPKQLWGMIHSSQILVKKTDDGLLIKPFTGTDAAAAMKKVRGARANSGLTVDKFLADRREEEGY